MRAVTLPEYGSADSLVVRDVEAPVPGDEDVLVDVIAASLNAADWHIIHGEPFPLRLAFGLRRPKIVAIGADVAGRVRAVGARVEGFSVGDEVIADLSGSGFSAFAEQACAPARLWVKKPAGLSLVDAAALPMAGMTALRGLRDVGKLRSGERVLVVGATSGVGTFAVQIARAFGADVTATSRAEKADLLKGLGITDIIDSNALDDTLASGALDRRFDLVFDCAAYRSPFAYQRTLPKGGRYVQVGGAMAQLMKAALLGPLVGLATGRRFGTFLQTADAALLSEVVALVDEGNVRPIVDRVFPLDDAAAAVRHMEARHTRGKIVISVGG